MRQILQAVLFDMDGTLVETEHYWDRTLAALAKRLGGRLSPSGRRAMVGTSMRVSMQLLAADLGLARTDEQMTADGAWVMQATEQLMAREVSWRPGARELLTAVRAAGLATALVTTTPRRLAAHVLRQIGERSFDVTVCGDEVAATKPDPAPYRQAMAALGVSPAGCVAVEDSVAGVTAAMAAGAAVLGVPSLQPLEPEPGLTIRNSLAGVRVADLAALVAGQLEARAAV